MKYITLLFLLLASTAGAQTVSITSNTTAASGSATPSLTWSTTPAATSCTASGGWSGAKAASGTQTLAAITASATYSLSCSFVTSGSTVLSWTPVTTNTDGTAATIEGYNLYQDDSATPSAATAKKIAGSTAVGGVIPASQLTYTVTGLAAGKHNWAVQAWTCKPTCAESALSPFATKTISPTTAASSVTVTVTVVPNAPSGLTAK